MTTNNAINNSFYFLQALINGSTLNDNTGATLLNFNTSGGTPVNSIQVVNGPTGTAPYFKAVGSDTNVPLFLQGQGTGGVILKGTGTNDSAATGYVGEYITSNIPQASATSLSNGTPKNITSISLTAGDWDVFGNIFFSGIGTTNPAYQAWTSVSSATLPDDSNLSYYADVITLTAIAYGTTCPYLRVSVNTTTTVYLSAQANFTAGTVVGSGSIFARRAR